MPNRSPHEKFVYFLEDRLTTANCLGAIVLEEDSVVKYGFKLSCAVNAEGGRILTLELLKPKKGTIPASFTPVIVSTLTSKQFNCAHPVKITIDECSTNLDNSQELFDMIMKVFVTTITEYCARLLARHLVDGNKKLTSFSALSLQKKSFEACFGNPEYLFTLHFPDNCVGLSKQNQVSKICQNSFGLVLGLINGKRQSNFAIDTNYADLVAKIWEVPHLYIDGSKKILVFID